LAQHSDEPSQQQPVVESAVKTAIATPIELTFMDYLTFFCCVSPETVSGSTA
jgi:hypothetical protein